MTQALQDDLVVQTTYGTVHYERGFEIVEIEGWVEEGAAFLYVCGNPQRPARGQRHTAIPVGRIVEIEYLIADV
jgi:hypothetical protein